VHADVPIERPGDWVTREYLEEHLLLPLARGDDRVVVAFAGRPDPQAVAELEVLFGARVALREWGEDELLQAVREAFGHDDTAAGMIAGMGGGSDDGDVGTHDLEEMANQAPVVRLVNLLLTEAVEAGASDVHMEAEARGMSVRYRVDGVLQPAPAPPAQLRAAVVSRLKIMAEMDIAERRLPQDGRVRLRTGDRELDVRVSTLPTLHGESVVLRLLDTEGERIGLEGMGMGADTLAALLGFAGRPHGVVLATGPTGSGKTTTLYGLLDRIRTGREKIVSVEDPVEYELAGVAQVPVNTRAGLTFARALRSILRQDPTSCWWARCATRRRRRSACRRRSPGTWCSPRFTPTTRPGALTRLVELGVPDYLVASTVEAVLAQRLVRRVCAHCAEPGPIDPGVARGMAEAGYPATSRLRGRGCPSCRGTGFRGRTGIYELLRVDDELRAELLLRPGADGLRRLALARGMRPLQADGWRQVAAGVTTPEEVLRVA
jgi:type II secretory ATPase GspE/PulE/Tfp pilus assembly ATPase PilB-like protein